MDEIDVLRDISGKFEQAGIPYMLTGSVAMNDTPPEIEKMVREKIMARSGQERLIMGAQMFEAARKMVLASFPPGLSEEEKKRRLFDRFYGDELKNPF